MLTLSSVISLNAQGLEDSIAIIKRLQGINIDGQFKWRPGDQQLKALSLRLLKDTSVEKTIKGVNLLIGMMTSYDYDKKNDPQFLQFLAAPEVRIDSFLFQGVITMQNHFLKSDYNFYQRSKLSFFSTPQSLLYWDPLVAEYLTFLELDSVGTTLLYLKRNLTCLTTLNPRLLPLAQQDTLLLNIHLARLGLFNDTTVVEQIIQSMPNYGYMIELLCKVRTPYAFARIGQFLLGEAIPERFSAESYRTEISKVALSAFIRYVANFPDRAIKFQDTMDRWNLVTFSAVHGRDYSTPEYMEWARQWYRDHQGALMLDRDKF